MRAAVLHEIGAGPAGLRVESVANPEPGTGEVLIAVRAVTASKLELEQTMTGVGLGRFVQLPRILGNDPSGLVVAVGDGADPALVGRRVAVKPNLVCGACRYCLSGVESDCTRQGVLGVHRDGGAAQYVAVPARQVFAVPDEVDDVTAAATVHTVAVAAHLLRVAGAPGSGASVLVTGAGGAIGSAVVALARSAGARVIGAASTRERAIEEAGGNDDAVDYAETDRLAPAVRDRLAGGADVVVETTGRGAVLAAAIDALAFGGIAVTCASQPGEQVRLNIAGLYQQRRTLRGAAASDFADVRRALAVVAAGEVRPRIRATFALEHAADAYRTLGDRGVAGRVVITVG